MLTKQQCCGCTGTISTIGRIFAGKCSMLFATSTSGSCCGSERWDSGARSIAFTSVPLALLSGALLALSFPRYGHPAVAWAALVPLIVALAQPATSRAHAWWLGLIAGAVYFAGTIYWTSGVMAQYGGIAWPLAAAIAGLLVAYMALFPAAWAWATRPRRWPTCLPSRTCRRACGKPRWAMPR